MTTGHYNCTVKRKILKEDILTAGRDLMFSKGYNATGIKDITDEVEIPKGSFYNHFSSKEEFGLEVIRKYGENGLLLYKNAFLASEGSPMERIRNFIDGIIKTYTDVYQFKLGCLMGNFSVEMADVNENFREILEEEFHAQEAVVIQCLKEAQEIGELRKEADADRLGSFFINSLHGAYVRMKATESAKPLEDFKVSMFEMLK